MPQRPLPGLLLFVLCLAALAPASAETRLGVAVSVLPQKYFVERIGGEHVHVTVMVPPGASPHTYEPKPSQMRAMAEAKLYFATSVTFEKAWLPRFLDSNTSMRLVYSDRHVQKLPIEAHRHGEEDDRHDEPGRGLLDPHSWLAPHTAQLHAIAIRDALIEADPANAADYRRGYGELIADIHRVDQRLQAGLLDLKQRTFLVFHPSWGYFAQGYNLKQLAIEQAGQEPGTRELLNIIGEAREHDIRVVFVQPQFSRRSAEQIAKAIDGEVISMDPLAEDWVANLMRVAAQLQEALSR